MELVEVTVFYLEMMAPTRRVIPPPRDGLTVEYWRSPELASYRSLYNAVGQDYLWRTKLKMSDEALAALIGDPLTEVHVFHVNGVRAGFAEFDRRQPREIEMVQFGLTREFIGQGLGKWFLQFMIDKAWSYQPQRFWLHTCTLDHAAALPNYLKSGFVQFKQEIIHREL
ncbi:MAG: Histone acetyltransferase [Planctomycetaceae bacterium]|nr:Histone acetyltransferase [Planctomycetaceae bacterium]